MPQRAAFFAGVPVGILLLPEMVVARWWRISISSINDSHDVN
jgi:hypothetical protein